MSYQLVLIQGRVERKEFKVNSYTGEKICLTPNSKLKDGFALVKEVNTYHNKTYYDGFNIKSEELLNRDAQLTDCIKRIPLTRFVYRSKESTSFYIIIARYQRLIPVIVSNSIELTNAFDTMDIGKGRVLALFETKNLFGSFVETELFLTYEDVKRTRLGFGLPARKRIQFDYSSKTCSRKSSGVTKRELVAQ